jgi:cytochrome P450
MSSELADTDAITLHAAWTLVSVARRHLLWNLPAISHELGVWRERAEAIPDRHLRAAALESLIHKRDHAEGAALFSVLVKRRNRTLIALLVAYQTLWDYLDSVSEHQADVADGSQLHLALVEALDPEAPISDYYFKHPWKDDGGYVLALVEACRMNCAGLPSYSRVRRDVLDLVRRCGVVQSLNHEPDRDRRTLGLKVWAESQSPGVSGLAWFELAGAASAVMPHALLALAAGPVCEDDDLVTTLAAYFPWFSLAISMLDSYADLRDDALKDEHSYMSYYGDEHSAVERLCVVVARTVREGHRLSDGDRHGVIIAAMVAMHLSNRRARESDVRESTRALARAGGDLTRLFLPAARLWRAVRFRDVTIAVRRLDRAAPQPELPPGPRLPRPVQTFVFWAAPCALLLGCRSRYGRRFTLEPTSQPPLVFLSDLADIKAVLAAPADVLHPGEGATTVEPVVGQESFMLLDEAEHLAGRKAILPAFHRRAIQGHADSVGEIAEREIASWPQDIPFAIHPRLRALTLEVVLRTALGSPGRIAEDRLGRLRDKLLRMLDVTGSVVFPEPLLRHGPGLAIWRRFVRERQEIDELIYEMIEERRHCQGGTADLLDRLLAARNTDGAAMSPQQIRDNLMSMILAGHETTAAQLAWAFQLLAHNPLVLDRLLEEIDSGGDGKYLTATIREVLRDRPVFLFTIPREVKQPIEVGGWSYRPTAQLLGCIYLLHHDPEIYPDPHGFRPERFLETSQPPPVWMPWGGGRKRCPGLHLAMLEMETVLRTVLETMTVRPASRRIEHPRWRSVIVTPHAGSRVVLQPRRRLARKRDHRNHSRSDARDVEIAIARW